MEIDFHVIAKRLYDRIEGLGDASQEPDSPPDDYLILLEEIKLEPLLTTPGEAAVVAPAHPDTDLVRRIQRGDMAAFEALFFKYQGHIYRTGLAITRDPGAAEEVLQDCFYKTYLNIMNITGDGSLSPWLHRVAVNLSCNAIKKRRMHTEPIDDVAEGHFASDPRHSPEAQAERAELQGTMRAAINALPLKHRLVITLHYLQDFSLPEIAYILDLPVGTVKSRLHHARKALRFTLETGQRMHMEAAYDPSY
ncbi:MAG: sigma-70 family RNA polymerase sigma factor [Chloroflexia bacterium]